MIQNQRKVKECVFNYIHILYYKCHKINQNGGGPYINYPDLIKNKKATINHINKKKIINDFNTL